MLLECRIELCGLPAIAIGEVPRTGEGDAIDSISGDAAERLRSSWEWGPDDSLTNTLNTGAKMKARNGRKQKPAKEARTILTSFESWSQMYSSTSAKIDQAPKVKQNSPAKCYINFEGKVEAHYSQCQTTQGHNPPIP